MFVRNKVKYISLLILNIIEFFYNSSFSAKCWQDLVENYELQKNSNVISYDKTREIRMRN